MNANFVTIGHSNRSLPIVAEMLRDARVNLVADVRAFPRSRSNPAFNIESFPGELEAYQIGYWHFEDLGGRRPSQPKVDKNINAFWRVQSFQNYADYALGGEFQLALSELERLARKQRVALMCAEAVWWRCHRRIITDYLLARNHKVDHLMAPGRTQPAILTAGANVNPDGYIYYPKIIDPV